MRLAHNTVKEFLLSKPIANALPEFHFSMLGADVEIGEVCVAYLCFNDFEMSLTRSSPVPTAPLYVLEAGLWKGLEVLGTTGKLFANLWLPTCHKNLTQSNNTINHGKHLQGLLTDPPSQFYRRNYRLLDYIIEA